jgi:hypothetical protein
MIKVGQKYIYNGPAGDPNNRKIVTVLPSDEFTGALKELSGVRVLVVSFDQHGFESVVLESELSEIG